MLINDVVFCSLFMFYCVLKTLSLFGATYGNTHAVAFTATLFAMAVLHVVNYRRRKKSN
ncbi:MAG: hypothetical protein GX857_03335 [Bacteroidales bacterium]|nr:hypothetical protein [Bacteroidales bacterium]